MEKIESKMYDESNNLYLNIVRIVKCIVNTGIDIENNS